MTGQRLLYRGKVDLDAGGDPPLVDVWVSDSAAVAFEGATQRGVLTDLSLNLTPDRRLRLVGQNGDGTIHAWVAVDAERIVGAWHNARVAWPDGPTWQQATVTWSQYGVRVTGPDRTPVDLVGARTEAVGAQRWIVDGETRIAASGRGCGCSGRR